MQSIPEDYQDAQYNDDQLLGFLFYSTTMRPVNAMLATEGQGNHTQKQSAMVNGSQLEST